MSDYQVTEIGALDQWRAHFGGFDAARSRDGRRVVDHELTMQYIGMTANALVPGLPEMPNAGSRDTERAMPS